MGLHGEPGAAVAPLQPAAQLVEEMMSRMLRYPGGQCTCQYSVPLHPSRLIHCCSVHVHISACGGAKCAFNRKGSDMPAGTLQTCTPAHPSLIFS
jgi:hypothetical protein